MTGVAALTHEYDFASNGELLKTLPGFPTQSTNMHMAFAILASGNQREMGNSTTVSRIKMETVASAQRDIDTCDDKQGEIPRA